MSDFLIQLSIYATNTFSPEVLILFCIFMISLSFLYLNVKGIRYREMLSVNCPNNIKGVIVISLSILISVIAVLLIKLIVENPRPIDMLVLENGFGFPSAHTAVIFAFCFSTLFILFKYFKDHNRIYLTYLHSLLFVSIAFLIAGTRLVLQVHTPYDILGGIIVGIISTAASIKIYYTITKYVDFKIIK